MGLFNRAGLGGSLGSLPTYNTPSWASTYNQVLGGFVAGNGAGNEAIPWSILQPTAGTPAGTGAISGAWIDNAFDQCDAWNNAHPTQRWNVKLRIMCGEMAQAWAQNLGVGPLNNGPGAGSSNCTAWWDATYLAAAARFMTTLAAYVPNYTVRSSSSSYTLAAGTNTQALQGHPLLGEVVNSITMTHFGEPCLKKNWNGQGDPTGSPQLDQQGRDSAFTAGYTVALDHTAQTTALASMFAAWPTTPVSFAFNPYQDLNVTGGPTINDTITNTLITNAIATMTWPYFVLENNSLIWSTTVLPPPTYSDEHGAHYTLMFEEMVANVAGTSGSLRQLLGDPAPSPSVPLCIQTDTYQNIGNSTAALKATFTYAVTMGARMIEVPDGFQALAITDGGGGTPGATWLTWMSGLAANDPVVTGGGPGPDSPDRHRHWRTYRHR